MLSILTMLVVLIACFIAMAELVLFCANVITAPPSHAVPYAPHHAPAHAPLTSPQQGQ